MERFNINKWTQMVSEFIDLEREFRQKHKSDFISTDSTNRTRSYGSDTWSDFKEYATIAFIGSTIIHAIISKNSEKINFLSLNWFIFYTTISLIASGVYLYLKNQKHTKVQEEISFLNNKLESIEAYYNQHTQEIGKSAEDRNNKFVVQLIKNNIERKEMTDKVIFNEAMRRSQEIIDRADENTRSIQDAADKLFRRQ
jgi:hypothetical protein